MPEIETTEEMLACSEVMQRLSEAGWALSDPDDQYALRQMWMAGRDWARLRACASCGEGRDQHLVICQKNNHMVAVPNAHAAAPGLPLVPKTRAEEAVAAGWRLAGCPHHPTSCLSVQECVRRDG